MYEGGGAGRSIKRKDEGAGRNDDVYKGRGVGLSAKMKDEGEGRNDVVRRLKG